VLRNTVGGLLRPACSQPASSGAFSRGGGVAHHISVLQQEKAKASPLKEATCQNGSSGEPTLLPVCRSLLLSEEL